MEGIQQTPGIGGPKWTPLSDKGGAAPGSSGEDGLRNLVGLPMAQFLQELMKKKLSEKLLEDVLATIAEGTLAQISPESLQSGLSNLDKILEQLPPEVATKIRSAMSELFAEAAAAANADQLPGRTDLLSAIQEALKDTGLQPEQVATLTAGMGALHVVVLAAWVADPAGLKSALEAGATDASQPVRHVGPDPSNRV